MTPGSRPASACSMVSALITSADQGQQYCPVCGCQYDSGKQRKLVDTNCGHARCFKCMFAVEQCPLCQVCLRPGGGGGGGGLEPGTTNHQSCISRESGFQSFNGSVSSIYSTTGGRDGGGGGQQPLQHLQLNGVVNVDQQIEMDRQSSTGSLLSLMSAQSALNMMAPPSVVSRYSMYDSTPAFNRVDQKRHSLSSLGKYQAPSLAPSSGGGSAASLSSRNSYARRSAIIPRNNRRSMQMSAIKEHQRKY